MRRLSNLIEATLERVSREGIGTRAALAGGPDAILLDLSVDLGLVIVVVGERGVDLRQRPMWMRGKHIFGRHTPYGLLDHDLFDFNGRAGDVRYAALVDGDRP